MNKSIYFLSFAALLASCSNGGEQKEAQDMGQHGLVIANMDTSVRAQDDFFRYVNGTWIDNTEIPGDQGVWGSFDELIQSNNKMVLKVLEDAASSDKYAAGSDQKKAADFYAVGMDSLLAENKKFEPLKEIFSMIDHIENAEDLQKFMTYQTKIGANAFFGFSIFPNLSDSKVNAAYIGQDGLGLPDCDYYLKTDEKSLDIQEKYRTHISKMLVLSGVDEESALAKAEKIYNLEYRMAKVSMNATEQRNIEAQNNPMSLVEIKALSPSIDWDSYLANLGVTATDTLIVMQPLFIAEMSAIVNDGDVQTWKDYLTWNMLNNYSAFLHHDAVETDFDFYGKTLRGLDSNRPRWKRTLGTTNGALGEAIGKLYVDALFPAEAKATAKEMVNDILASMGNRINNLDWMSDSTKVNAIAKLQTIVVKIGYPDKWKDYSTLEVKRGGEDASFLTNVLAMRMWKYEDQLAKLHEPVDRAEWGISPQTVNAYYNPLNNEIVFPAAILQPPFFDFKADAAVNYGGIGAVIGHELSHGFDDKGSQFDKDGNFANWWAVSDLEAFQSRGSKLVEQFNNYEAIDSVFINGELTLGENIGDLGGVNLAYDGLHLYLDRNPDANSPIDGFTPDQRFFMSWATIWRTKMREEELRNRILTDSHSPGMVRAFAPLKNIDAFYSAFNLKEGDGMYLREEDRVKIW